MTVNGTAGKMRTLALSDDVLLSVQKPARYIGNEGNAVYKDRDKIEIRFAMCFPDVYEVGMSHLGIQILYDMFNRREDTWCERVYSPWLDLDKILRERKIPLFALESQDPIRDFDFLGITLQFELCYTNVLQILDLSGIPLKASERDESVPIVIGGGPCSYNPEPIAEFFDMFYIGEGETVYDQLLDLYKEMKVAGRSRREFLIEAARQVPGIYVPSLYEVTYKEDGTIASFAPTVPGVPEKILKQTVKDLDAAPYPLHQLVPFIQVTQDRAVVEIQRGCIRGCRFCQAGMIYRPNRERDLSTVQAYADSMLETGQLHCGYIRAARHNAAAAVAPHRFLLSRRHGEASGRKAGESDLCPGGGLSEAQRRHKQGNHGGGDPARRAGGLPRRLEEGQALFHAGPAHGDAAGQAGDRGAGQQDRRGLFPGGAQGEEKRAVRYHGEHILFRPQTVHAASVGAHVHARAVSGVRGHGL